MGISLLGRVLRLYFPAVASIISIAAAAAPIVVDGKVSYIGKYLGGVESFLNIKYGQDTGGKNRFKQPRTYTYPAGTVVNATSYGAACPQKTGNPTPSLIGIFGNVSEISEDCLTVRVDRPARTRPNAKLPVMVYLYGGGYNIGQAYDTAYYPNGLVRENAAKQLPVVYVAINYRVGIFGFAATSAIRDEGNLNVGLLDQYLGLQWVQAHIAAFGGDKDDVTIFGEDTGWANVAFQLTAYGGSARPTFKKAILMSGPTTGGDGITSGSTEKHVADLIKILNCTSSTNASAAELDCLRVLPLDTLVNAAVEYAFAFDPLAGVGTFKPIAPSPFVPSSPAQLLRNGHFLKDVDILIGWCEDDGTQFVSPLINSSSAFTSWATAQFPGLSAASFDELLSLYPASEFSNLPSEGIERNYFRAARVTRDVHFACPSLLLTDAYSMKSSVYLWTLNYTVFRVGHALYNRSFVGQDHFSDIPYVFDYVNQLPYSAVADQTDYYLASLISGSWALFARYGRPTLPFLSAEDTVARNLTLAPWQKASSPSNGDKAIRIIGGPRNGMATIPPKDSGYRRGRGLPQYDERLATRCAFWNRPDVLEQTFMKHLACGECGHPSSEITDLTDLGALRYRRLTPNELLGRHGYTRGAVLSGKA